MPQDPELTEVIEREFDKLIKSQLIINQNLSKILEDHEHRLRIVEKYAFGVMGGYALLMTFINVWEKFK